MSRRRSLVQAHGLTIPAILLALGPTVSAFGAAARPPFARTLSAFDAGAVERAKAGAAHWLEQPECSKLLTEFTDGDGRTLDRSLATWGLSAAEYVLTLSFRDGTAIPRCGQIRIELVTVPGLPQVYVCPGSVGASYSRFARTQTQSPSLAEAMVIHEMLHTLGLGENPPSSLEITERVRARCR
jgi:hypothetical protein